MKHRIHEILEHTLPNDRPAQVFGVFIVSLISLNVVALIFGTVDHIYQSAPWAFQAFEAFSVAIFTAEYALRIWACTTNAKYRKPVVGRIRFAIAPVMVLDLLAVLPYYALLIFSIHGLDLRVLRAVRLMVRLARMGRHSTGFTTLARVVNHKRGELGAVIVVLGALMVMTSSLIYFAEHEAQPDKFPNIPRAMWWSVITLTTIGYGDVFPITTVGRMLAGTTAILGIGLFALPAGILGSGFVDELRKNGESRIICPHCGRQIED